jgi:serine/threonine-protein phosphatase with EF-hand domain
VVELLHHTKAVLKTQANIRLATTKQSREITICGDIHGKFDDLLVMLYKNNLPSSENPFVFNGDFVDRGQFSVEVVLVLFTLLQLYPNDVYLNRGNHEDYIINMKYGFTKEIELKYKHHAQVVCAMFQDVFKWLPLGCLIDGKVLVVHGGVSQETDIKYLQNIKRSKVKLMVSHTVTFSSICTLSVCCIVLFVCVCVCLYVNFNLNMHVYNYEGKRAVCKTS